MGIFSRFGRRSSSPHEWTQLWDLLSPLGGKTTPDAVDRWSRWARELPEERLTTAADQLRQAYDVLDTEKHGRALGVEPFSGIDRPFARLRFLRVLDGVILAGPDAVERVADAPELVRGHDTVHLLDPELTLGDASPAHVNLARLLDEARVLRGTLARSVEDLRGVPAVEAWVAMSKLDFSSATNLWTTSRRWPTVRSAKAPLRQRFALEDPEVAWIDVDASMLCGDDSGDVEPDHGHHDCWVAAGHAATLEVYRALGGAAGAQHELAHRHVVVEAMPADEVTGDGKSAPDVGPDALLVFVELGLSDLEQAVVDPQARVALLVRRTAERLSRAALPWSGPNREALVALASGARP